MDGAFRMHGAMRRIHTYLVGKHKGKIPLRRPKSRWEDNIRINLQEIGCGLD
jgi:hypothetical protein